MGEKMNEDAIDAVLAEKTLKAIRRGPTSAATTVTPVEPVSSSPMGALSYIDDDVEAPRAALQAKVAYAAAEATLGRHRGRRSEALAGWDRKHEAAIRGAIYLTMHAFETGLGPSAHMSASSRVHRYVTKFEPLVSCVMVGQSYPTIQAGAFSLEAAIAEPQVWEVPVTFNCVDFVEQYEARTLRLLAELQNGAAVGRASVQRIRQLQEAAREEGEALSLDALEALVAFANDYPEMATPELTLAPDGSILSEWRHHKFGVTLLFHSPANVQYLVKRANPWHVALNERFSGTTTVDLVGERLRMSLPTNAWPIRA